MKILALESASLVASTAIWEDGEIIAEYTTNYKKTHSQTLLPMLDEIVKMTDTDLNSVDAIAVSAGPGSFTGLRIGAATAKGLGLALDKPLIAVPTLDATAYNMYETDKLICPIMDARRGEVYNGLYHNNGKFEVVSASRALSIDELAAELNKRGESVIFSGDGVPVHKAFLQSAMQVPHAWAPAHLNRQRAAAVAQLGSIYLSKGITVSADEMSPVYLRKSQAERERTQASGGDLSKDLFVRHAMFSDESAITKLESEIFKDAWNEKLVNEMLNSSYDEVYVIEASGDVIGYCNLRHNDSTFEIMRICILPQMRGRGYSKLLMDQMIAYAKQKNADAVMLEVREDNAPAFGLYRKYGFDQIGKREKYYGDVDAIIMKRG